MTLINTSRLPGFFCPLTVFEMLVAPMAETENVEKEAREFVKGILVDYPGVKSFLAGSLSGTLSTVIFQPLDLVKTRLQAPMPTLGDFRGARNMGMLPILTHIYQTEQVLGLWRGMTPSLVRCVPGVGLYFSTLHTLKNHLQPAGAEPLGALKCVALGASARCVSGILLIPFTVLKTRFESGVYRYNGMSDGFKKIYQKEGAKGLVCGLVPTLFRDAPFSGLYLMFYTQTKQTVPKEWLDGGLSSPLHFSCGIIAGILASIVTQPADVIKTKMQLYPNEYKSIISAVTSINKKNGISGYFAGLAPRMLRRTMMAAMAWTLYEQISRSIGLK